MIPDRSHISTEQINPASLKLDEMPIAEAVALMNAQDRLMVEAIGRQQAQIAAAVEIVAGALADGGRLIYVGAGTSGRLGVLDASECPPTFCSDPAMVLGIIAGGDAALRRSIENVEDDRHAGQEKILELHVGPKDVVFGIAAGGTTPFVHAALEVAATRGAKTVFLVCTKPEHIGALRVDVLIPVEVGPEVLTGSTRLKAGSATKLVLNTITTLAMVQIGKTYGNLMVDLDAGKNAKLVDRGARIIAQIAKMPREEALALLTRAGGKVKRAIVMHVRRVSAHEADELLAGARGRLKKVIG